MKGNQMVTTNLFKVTLAIRSVMLALVMVTLAFADDIDFAQFAETSDLEQAGVRINLGECRTQFARSPSADAGRLSDPGTSRTITIPPSWELFYAAVPKRQNHSGRRYYSSSIAVQPFFVYLPELTVMRWPVHGKPLKLSDEYNFDQLIRDITQLQDISSLSCPFTPIKDQHIHSVANAFPKLKCLELGGCAITDDAVISIAKLSELRILDLSDTAISAKSLEKLSRLKSLLSLSLGGCLVDDDSVASLIASLPHLEMIFLHGTHCGTAALKALAARERLTVIDLSQTPVDDTMVASLLTLRNLEEIYLDETRLSAEAFRGVSSAKNLKRLSIIGVPVDNQLFQPRGADSELDVWREREERTGLSARELIDLEELSAPLTE